MPFPGENWPEAVKRAINIPTTGTMPVGKGADSVFWQSLADRCTFAGHCLIAPEIVPVCVVSIRNSLD